MNKKRRGHGRGPIVFLFIFILALGGSLFAGNQWGQAQWTPNLDLDLAGGTEIIMTPRTEDNSTISSQDISQAIEIIRQRVDSSGVSEAEITSQGGTNIVVGLPGQPDPATIELIHRSAQMTFRQVLEVANPAPPDFTQEDMQQLMLQSMDEDSGVEVTDAEGNPIEVDPDAEPIETGEVASGTREEAEQALDVLNCLDPQNRAGGFDAPAEDYMATCGQEGEAKYLLGPVMLPGSNISDAYPGLASGAGGTTTSQWAVNLEFDSEGTTLFRDISRDLVSQAPPQNQFAMVLDGLVISAPTMNNIIHDGRAQITGQFNEHTAAVLANQLSFGSLPITFDVQSQTPLSATLGAEQLENAILAGLIGFILIVVYLFIQYRALGIVTTVSLGIAGVLVYLVINVLSWLQGFSLSLAGIAGLILAISIVADSFILYFERIKDELRDGKNIEQAVNRGWDRAKRTIVASDLITLLASIVLYFLAVGNVRGFAFTLGLTTLIDLFIVFTFTHPVMKVITRWKFFASGHPASGLDPSKLGRERVRYVGRGKVKTPASEGAGSGSGLSIAERKKLAAQQEQTENQEV